MPSLEVELNEPFLDALGGALDRARERGHVAGAMTPGDLLRFPQALTIREKQDGRRGRATQRSRRAWRRRSPLALDELDAMRTREGESSAGRSRCAAAVLATLFERSPRRPTRAVRGLEQRLAERVRELRAELLADEALSRRRSCEFAARSDISEEVARFRGHLAHWEALADGPEPCGRKLDFLLQEMNREVNTMGSKADGLRVSELIIAAKAELEKMREQVQNVE